MQGPCGVRFCRTVVVEELLDEVDVRQQHAPAAVATKAEGIEGVHLTVVRTQQVDVLLPTHTRRRGVDQTEAFARGEVQMPHR